MKIPLLIPVFLICFTSLCMGTDASVPDVDRISSLERINMADSLPRSELNP
jgi:hypothetical protein